MLGWVGLLPALLYSYGAAVFCNRYKESSQARGGGFMALAIGSSVSAALVGVCAIKGALGPLLPY